MLYNLTVPLTAPGGGGLCLYTFFKIFINPYENGIFSVIILYV